LGSTINSKQCALLDFFAADTRRPNFLAGEGLALSESRFTYAIGKIVLWHPKAKGVDAGVLKNNRFRFLAIANPKHSPYGRAAMEAMIKLDLFGGLKNKIVRGENISKTFQFIKSDNIELGMVAYSKLISTKQKAQGTFRITLEHQSATNILNIFPATVDELRNEGTSQVTVRLLVGGVSMLSRITRKSAAVLELVPGKQAFAQTKSIVLLA